MIFQSRPVIRPKFEDCDGAAFQILLMLEILVGDDQQLKSLGFGAIEQFAVADPLPAHFDGGRYVMGAKCVADLNGNRFV